jgi:stage II sporulation protein P
MTKTWKRLGQVGLLLGVILLLAVFYTPLNRYNPFFAYRVERPYYTTFIDAAGNRLWATAHPVFRGDELWTGPDTRFVVRRVRNRIAHLEAAPAIPLDQLWRPAQTDPAATAAARLALPLAAKARNVALFHTHVSESYIPTQGEAFVKGAGGILYVGAVFAEALQGHGFTVVHDRTSHDPHDAGAYSRSRRTALNLLRNHRPFALFDVHRDAAPLEFYQTIIDGQETSRMMLVIGRANPLQRGNIMFARRLMAVGEGLYPDLFQGLFMGRGHYNQDLDPGMVLVEAGTYVMAQPVAERGVRLFAHVVAATAGLPGAHGSEYFAGWLQASEDVLASVIGGG